MPSKTPLARLAFTRGALVTLLTALQSRANEIRRAEKRAPSAARQAELVEVQELAARVSAAYHDHYNKEPEKVET